MDAVADSVNLIHGLAGMTPPGHGCPNSFSNSCILRVENPYQGFGFWEKTVAAKVSRKWAPCPKAVSVLEELGIPFRIANVAMDKIDWKATEYNSGRSGRAITPDTVDDYTLFMQRGDVFPMPVASIKNGKATIVAGVHRSQAALKNGEPGIDCYVIDSQPELTERLVAVSTNRKEGIRLDKHEALEHAVHAVNDFQADPADVCRLFGVKLSALQDKLRVVKRRADLAKLGFRGSLTDTALTKMGSVAKNDRVLLSVARLVDAYNLPTPEVQAICAKVAKGRTERQQLEDVEREASVLAQTVSTPHKRITQSVRTNFLSAFHKLQTVVGGSNTPEALQIVSDSDEHKQLKKEWKALKRNLDAIFQ